MHLGLMGMAGVGKSYWAARFAEAGFTCFHCEDIIASHLRAELGEALVTVHDLGDWMGFPHQPDFAAKEAKYLALEEQTLRDIVRILAENDDPDRRFVVDMTGSAVYVDEDLLRELRRYGPTQRLPCVLISARTDTASVRTVLPLTPAAYLGKPYDLADLRQRLDKLLPRSAGHAGAPRLPRARAAAGVGACR